MGTQNQVFSGNGFMGLEPEENPIGIAGSTGYDFKPVARWTDLPAQIKRNENIYVGVSAFHSEGIKEVEFILNGGTGITVDTIEINPDTNLPEYFVRINRTDILNKMNSGSESMINVELRAIVRPNTGQVKILQHDMDEIKGPALTESIGGFFGMSGGGFPGPNGTDIYVNERFYPGEHSYFCSILKENSNSELPDVVKYIATDGSDSNDGTESNPVKTMDKCLELLRNEFASQGFTYEYDGAYYVDASRGVVRFLDGNYNGKDHYHCGDRIGNRQLGNEALSSRYSFFRVTGNPDDNEAVVMYVPDDEKIPVDPETGEPYGLTNQENPNSFNLNRSNDYLSLVKLENFTVLREHSGVDESNWSYFMNPVPSSIRASPIVYYHCELFENIIFDNRTIGKEASTLWAGVATNFPAFINCKTYGGKQTYQYGTWLRGNELYKNVADNLKQFAFAANNKIINTDGAMAVTRRLHFDPNDPTTAPYAKFNGLYCAIRDFYVLRGCTAIDQQDWFINPTYQDENGNWKTLYNAIIMYLKIKPEKLLDFESGYYKDKKTDDPSIYTYDELGVAYGMNSGTYFGNTTEREQTYTPITKDAPF